eukprot:CAMPEP_0181187456 /NCGR_PEP_ID=MMETSP1096-20121128/10582_1 /TAXON_ID=156174 ORGANISM="Chrysochromulina ericina, Strain CCMP281" /NCGR_SAMPLE_ID=MMETSP1096 /ASSEMBLY_ACC=CAM_ASM_000453 /LENGTH=122 /DNA_ID=CAMNT_0023276431 /DNA_START=10 /DNA_END=378 /DNA_ORIENTATION=+
MSMTAPVRSSSDGSQVKVSFVVPSEYTMETAPTPSDRAVSLCTVAPHCLAVRTFSGPPPSERRVELERSRVVEALGAAGLQIAPGADGAETLIYGYHDPFITPNFLRKNEVAVRIRPLSKAA